MLLASDEKKIYLLPAWPEDWDVSFKLCAARNTTVEGVYRNGQWQSLKVTPESRRADLVDCSTPENRIRNLVSVACNDRNYLFGLPPMLDGLPVPGPVTDDWLRRFGESLTQTRGAPWPDCTFRDRTLYAFSFNGPAKAPQVAAKVTSQKTLASLQDSPVSILKVTYDQPLEPLARATHLRDSLTLGKPVRNDEVDLGAERTFDHLEFTLDLPTHRRGDSIAFDLQARRPDGQWRSVHKGAIYGNIYAKKFAPVTARQVRLVTKGNLAELHLFAPVAHASTP
jgi:hypothetical protein